MIKYNDIQITLDQLKALIAIVEHGGYSKAAEALNKSHTSLIYLIRGLEDTLQIQLFNRDSYRNKLTSDGEKIYQKAKLVIQNTLDLQTMTKQKDSWEDKIKIVFDALIDTEPFLKMYKLINQKKIPTVIQTHTDYLHDVEVRAHELEADIMITLFQTKKMQPWIQQTLNPIKNYLVAHRDHELNKSKKKWNLDELKQFHFLTVRNSGIQLGLNTRELEDQSSFFLSDFQFKKQAILKKIGFGWLPEHMIEDELKSGLLVPIKWERANQYSAQPYLYIRKSSSDGKALKLILNELVADE